MKIIVKKHILLTISYLLIGIMGNLYADLSLDSRTTLDHSEITAYNQTISSKLSHYEKESPKRKLFINQELDRFVREMSTPNYQAVMHRLIHDGKRVEIVTDEKQTSPTAIYLQQTADHQKQDFFSKGQRLFSLEDLGLSSLYYIVRKICVSENNQRLAIFVSHNGNTEYQKVYFVDVTGVKILNHEPLTLSPIKGDEYTFLNNDKFAISSSDSRYSYIYDMRTLDAEMEEKEPSPDDHTQYQIDKIQIGHKQALVVTDKTTNTLYNLDLPKEVLQFSATEQNGKIHLELESQFDMQSFIWNPLKSKPTFPKFKKSDYLHYQDELIPSLDGTLIPIRLIYKSTNFAKARKSHHPVLLHSYGGFNCENLIASSALNSLKLKFIEDGGIIVTTGLRGGSEYGIKWHTAGSGFNKHKPVEDLAAVAKWLIQKNITTKEKIISYGASNGGFTVTLSALKYPEYFGLVITNAGVLDLMAKENLDALYGGWFTDFPNSSSDKRSFKYIYNLSPLENIQKHPRSSEFLILTGEADSRVNPAHSYKFAAALKERGDIKYNLVTLHSAGHMGISYQMSGQMGVRYQHAMWTKIYNYLNQKF